MVKPDGWSSEELKVRNESRKILGLPHLKVHATCVRVPVVTTHAVAVHAEFEREVTRQGAQRVLAAAPGVVLSDDPEQAEFPTPADDRFWARALELNMPLTAHMNLAGSEMGRPPVPLDWENTGLPYDLRDLARSLNPFTKFNMYAVRGAGNAVQMIFDGLAMQGPSRTPSSTTGHSSACSASQLSSLSIPSVAKNCSS